MIDGIFKRENNTHYYERMVYLMNKTKLMLKWQTFIGIAKKRGATEEELSILVKAADLVRKYCPETKEES